MKETSFLNKAEKKALELIGKEKINIKSLKNSRGHEGESCPYGNLYIGTKKQGSFNEDTWGGGMMHNISDELEKNLQQICEKSGTYYSEFFKEEETLDMSDLIYLLIDLKEYSTKCKKKCVIKCKDKRGSYTIEFQVPFIKEEEKEFVNEIKKDVIEYEILNKRY